MHADDLKHSHYPGYHPLFLDIAYSLAASTDERRDERLDFAEYQLEQAMLARGRWGYPIFNNPDDDTPRLDYVKVARLPIPLAAAEIRQIDFSIKVGGDTHGTLVIRPVFGDGFHARLSLTTPAGKAEQAQGFDISHEISHDTPEAQSIADEVMEVACKALHSNSFKCEPGAAHEARLWFQGLHDDEDPDGLFRVPDIAAWLKKRKDLA